MLRMAARTADGKAKSVVTTEQNGIKTVNNAEKRYLFTEGFELLAGAERTTAISKNNGYNYVQATVSLSGDRIIEVYLSEYSNTTVTEQSDLRKLVYRSDEKRFNHSFTFPLTGENYTLTIKNIDTIGASVRFNSYEMLFVNPSPQTPKFIERQWLKIGQALNSGDVFESKVFTFDGHPFSKAVVALSSARNIRISIKNIPNLAVPIRSKYDVVYESKERLHNHYFEFETLNNYQVKIENIDTLGTDLTFYTKEFRFSDPITTSNDVEVVDTENINLLPLLQTMEKTQQKTPSKHLIFNKSTVKSSQLNLCDDGLFYVLGSDSIIRTYKSITEVPELIGTGITWDTATHGRVKRFVAFPDGGLTVFTDNDVTAYIYHMNDINSAPELVYQSSGSTPDFWSGRNGFGIKSYFNGMNGYILAGVYGRGESKKDLLFSNDYGETFTVVKQTTNVGGHNSHWHDVAFDTYSGLLWASEGDEIAGNQNVFVSDDWGNVWRKIPTKTKDQPTAIMPFSDRVIFGRDSKLPGLDYYKKPLSGNFNDSEILTLMDYKIDTSSYKMYGHSPVVRGKEAYLTHNLYPETNPNLILGTGDGGKSFHSVFMAKNEANVNVDALIGVDDKFIYAHGNPANRDIWYAEKPEWE